MSRIISMQDIRTSLAEIADAAERGERFVVIRNSRPSFQVTPLDETAKFYGQKTPTLKEMRAKFEANPIKAKALAEAEVDDIIHRIHREASEGA